MSRPMLRVCLIALIAGSCLLAGCSVDQDDSNAEGLEATTYEFTEEVIGSVADALSESEAYSVLDDLVSSFEVSKNDAIQVTSGRGKTLYEGDRAMQLVADLQVHMWKPISSEAMSAAVKDPDEAAILTFVQNDTIRLGEEVPSERSEVARIYIYPSDNVAELRASAISLPFAIPASVSEVAATL